MLDWKILGKDALPVSIQTVWEEQVVKLSARKKDKDRFLSLWRKADLSYFFDTIHETHVFKIHLPPTTAKQDILFMDDFMKRVIRSAKAPLVSLEGEQQASIVVITAEIDYNEYSLRQDEREQREKKREITLAELEKKLH